MTDRLPSVSAKDVIRVLQRAGFVLQRQKGSHATLRHPDTRHTVVVPVHAGDIKRPLFKTILAQAGMSAEDFRALL